ncbi:cytochrome P450 [Artomyces pyxidatus]|uniref:Cytochrome P450 n=1 Tax=Artomyces pyxidatus TaxID=48021 RepID=A0ACB8TEU0_9AGAM|nr:cytochrome P450 [Artomyces pyxidatus]
MFDKQPISNSSIPYPDFALPRQLAIQHKHALFLSAVLVLITVFAVEYLTSPRRKLPPGPRGWPLLGNAMSLGKAQWLTFTEWKKTYGDVVYISAFGKPIVILNSQKAAIDLLDRRAGMYSDRPDFIVAADVIAGGLALPFQHYGPLWRRMRRATHEGLGRGATGPFRPTQLREAVNLALAVLAQPAAWPQHIRRASSSMVMSVTYDTPPIESEDDPRVKDIIEFSGRLTRALLPGAHLVELLPWMKHIPSRYAKWKREGEEQHMKFTKVFENMYRSVAANLENGIDRSSVCASLFKEADRNQLSVRENTWIAAIMYIAGSETSSSALEWWMLAAVAHPETQKSAQAELDTVVGRARIPTFADLPHLPYVRAMAAEALRWRPLDPLGVPHRTTQDDWYEGTFIPKGTTCIANLWALSRDPALFGNDAHLFKPERFLEGEEGHVAFGFGRRVCPGRHVANDSLCIGIAAMLWACTLEPARDEQGQPVTVDVDGFVDQGLSVRPVHFACSAEPRFLEAPVILAGERELLREH